MAHVPHQNNNNPHHAGWQAFTRYSTYATLVVVCILILMAIFLV